MEQFNPKPVAEDIETKVGDLSELDTTEKTSLVGAVNELNEQIGAFEKIEYKENNVVVATVYRYGRLRILCVGTKTMGQGIAICNVDQQDIPTAFSPNCYTKVYNGSTYVECYLQLVKTSSTQGILRLMDLYGNAIAGAQTAYLKSNYMVYLV